MASLVDHAKKISIAVEELKTYQAEKKKNPQQHVLQTYNQKIKEILQQIEQESGFIFQTIQSVPVAELKQVTPKPLPSAPALKTGPLPFTPLPAPQPLPSNPAPKPILSPSFTSQKFKNLSLQEKNEFIQELKISYAELDDFVALQKLKAKGKGPKEIKKADYTIYKPNEWGATSNKYMKKYADQLIKKYPKLFQPLFDQFQKVNMPILSRSYVSMTLFFGILALPLSIVLFVVLNLAFQFSWILVFAAAILAVPLTMVAFYFYPGSLIGDRQKLIKNDLPFALIHMSAVAGSGAHPISIFELLVESEEYPELKKEVRKLLNYVNLFGYNLSNALRNVAITTPSPELKELLNGMVSTIETGGDLKGYLKEKAEDALNTYRLDRKKEVEALATFSEVYTAILIAAPLLMVITLAIMNTIGGQIAGLSINFISQLGILVALPILNIGFMFFLKNQSANL
ncbi:type II secretion system F family protein [Candidatus Woesearchaeota archaeon]|nr:type II secretion system F family protein [Candidatus Woesearchaeota archaeon]